MDLGRQNEFLQLIGLIRDNERARRFLENFIEERVSPDEFEKRPSTSTLLRKTFEKIQGIYLKVVQEYLEEVGFIELEPIGFSNKT